MKKDLIKSINIGSVEDAKDILNKAGTEDLFEKARPKTLQVGQSHPVNPNLVWTDLGNGRYAWRSKKGKYYRGGQYNSNKDPLAKKLKKRKLRPIGAGTNGIEPMMKKKEKK